MSTASEAHTEAFDAEQFARGFHLYNAELQDDPYPMIDRLRDGCPVAHSEVMGGFWVVTRYQDCRFVLQNPGLFSSVQMTVPHYQKTALGPDIPTQIDPPDHGKYRKILNPLLSPRVVAALQPRMHGLVGELIDSIIEAGRCDFIADFAVPYPSLIFVPLMGLPESDLDTFLDWKNKILHTFDPEEKKKVFASVNAELEAYFTEVFNERRRRADPGDDLVGSLAKARFDGERPLSLEEFVGITTLLWSAGLDTVTAQLSLAIHRLATRPDLRDQLAADLSLVPYAVEELMRFDGLVNDCRKATTDIELGGKTIKAGDMVMVMYGAAGRDPEQFPDPYRIDFTRHPNPHFGFGGGIHRCAGSHLARTEMRVAMEEIHRRMPHYSLDPAKPVGRHFGYVRGLDSLHLLIDR
ncbi:cytochrome P450 [Dactylosporangium sp. AC04546]|uniref:cytochrome P450 n=1 Tax=Dactylosporangium sp. AC04546 TaxID=2862460 RepID=UPI001EDF73D9|nr:cytochrome P450 [Dactylosporangium sp. AC04546]WVK86913.1 cytochrome P450 [Dactylosporangium sp. AC04546]